jgi:hypothetical protein
LANLRKFPFDTIKIDRQFVAGMIQAPNDRTMVGAIIELAHKLGLTVVAEGVETAEQLAALRELGCDLCQGYFLGRPGPPEDIESIDGLADKQWMITRGQVWATVGFPLAPTPLASKAQMMEAPTPSGCLIGAGTDKDEPSGPKGPYRSARSSPTA